MWGRIVARYSLQFVVTTVVVSLLTVMAAVTWLITYRNSQGSIRALADQLGRLSMDNIHQKLQRYLEAPKLVNAINEYSFSSNRETFPGPEVLAGRFGAELARFQTVISIAYADQDGNYVGMTRDTAGVPFALAVADASTAGYLAAFRSSPQGIRGAEFERSSDPFDARLRPWYTQALAAAEPSWTPVYLWITGDAGLDFVTPVRDPHGRFLGVLDASLTLAELGSFLDSVRVTPHSTAFIIEPSGTLVATSGTPSPYRAAGRIIQRFSTADSSNPVIRAGGARIRAALAAGESFDGERAFALRISGQRQLMRAARFHDSAGLDWYFAEVVPESEFAQPVYDDMRSTGAFAGAFLLASVLVALVLARRIGAPLKLLTAAARRMGGGELVGGLPVSGTVEVRQLSSSFNLMAVRLQRSFSSLAESEARYRAIFHRSAVSLLEADVSRLHAMLEELSARGITDVEAYLRGDRELLRESLRMLRIVDANETAVALLGAKSREDLIGPLSVRFEEDVLVRFVPEAIANARKGLGQALETRVTTATGATLDIILTLYVPGEGEALTNMLISVVDITQRNQAERERAALQEELRQAQKVETIGRLAGGIAHDINNLLTPVLAGAELLLSGEPSVDPRETAQDVLGSANRIRELTHKLLAFSRKQPLKREVARLDVIAADFQSLLRRMLRPGVDLRFLRGEGVLPVQVDVGQVEQVLMNLVVNAQDAMPSGGTITVDVRNAVEAGVRSRLRGIDPKDFVALTVSDTGCGMDAAVREHLFEPFFTTKAPGRGTGLGLSTVYGIVRQHGGHILVESDPGWGTRFRVLIPQHEPSSLPQTLPT